MQKPLSKKARMSIESYVLRHGRFTCHVRKPYVVAFCTLGNFHGTGIGFAKWNPNDANTTKYDYNEPRGTDIAIGRAIIDLVSQMDGGELDAYISAAYNDKVA